MSWLWDQKSIKGVEAQLEKEAAERDVRRGQAELLNGASPTFRNRFRREFLLTDPIQRRRRRLIAYILSLTGILLLLIGNILSN